MNAPLPLRFVTSSPDVASLPPTRAEVAVIGRSNVGKSSLLNAVAGTRELAKTSGKPGRTRLLNVFAVEGTDTAVVDLPGFGYAQISKQDRSNWRRRMEHYLVSRAPLVLALLLVDGEIGPTKLDLEMMAWLRDQDVAFQIVATKHDKVKSSRRERRRRDLAEGCGVTDAAVIWTSAEKNVGIDRLRGRIREALEVTV